MTETQEKVTRRFVVTGKTTTTTGKQAVRIQWVNEDGTLAKEPAVYAGLKTCRVGSMYEIEATPDGMTVWPRTADWIGGWPDEIQRLQWESGARAYDLARATARTRKSEETRHLLREAMTPLHWVYQDSSREQRLALEVLVLEALRYGAPGTKERQV